MKKAVSIIAIASLMALVLVNLATAGTVMDRILKNGELVVGTTANQPPLIAKTKTGKIIGFDADLAQAMARNMGVRLKLTPMPFSMLLPALEAGKLDMVLSGMTMTGKRNTKVAFVGPYMQSGKAFLSKIKTIASADDTTELNSPKIKLAALKGSTSQRFVEAVLPRATLVTTSDYDEGVDMVLRDEVHAMVAVQNGLIRQKGQGFRGGAGTSTGEGVNMTENHKGLRSSKDQGHQDGRL